MKQDCTTLSNKKSVTCKTLCHVLVFIFLFDFFNLYSPLYSCTISFNSSRSGGVLLNFAMQVRDWRFFGFYIFKYLLRIFHTEIQGRLISEEIFLTKVVGSFSMVTLMALMFSSSGLGIYWPWRFFSVNITCLLEPLPHSWALSLGTCWGNTVYTFLNNILTQQRLWSHSNFKTTVFLLRL